MDGITDSMNMSVSKPMEIVKARGAWKAAVQWVAKSLTDIALTATKGYVTRIKAVTVFILPSAKFQKGRVADKVCARSQVVSLLI